MRNAAAASSAMPSLAPMAIFAATVCFVAACLTAISISVAYITPLRDLPSDGARICTTDLTCPSYQRLTYDGNCASCVDTLPVSAVGGQNSLTDFVPAAFRFEDAVSVRNVYETGWTGSTFSGVSTTFVTGVSGFTIVDGYYRKTFYPAGNNTMTGIGTESYDLSRIEVVMRGTATITNATEAPIVVIMDMTTSDLFTTIPTFTYGIGTFGWNGGFAPVGTVTGTHGASPSYPNFVINNKPTQPVGGAGVWVLSLTMYQINYAL